MSLTRLLDDRHGPVRTWFEDTLPNVKPIAERWKAAGSPAIIPAWERPAWGLLGAAVDYRIRYFFACTPPREFVAAYGANTRALSDDEVTAMIELRMAGEDSFDRFAAALDVHVTEHDPVGGLLDPPGERLLAKFCFVLAMYETVFRTGRPSDALDGLGSGASAEAQLALVPEEAVDDLVALAEGFVTAGTSLLGRPTVLNPTFAGSLRVGGADADLIVDGLLLEVKTTKAARPDRDWVYQLVGYLLLDVGDEHQLERLGFYVSRVPTLLDWDADELLALLAGRPAGRRELRDGFFAAVEQAGPVRRLRASAGPTT